MKKFSVLILLVLSSKIMLAQSVGIGTSNPHPNAILDITSSDKGILIPRMDSNQRKAIPQVSGLMVYDSTTKSFWFSNGTSWIKTSTTINSWSTNGNSGTKFNENFIGTTDSVGLRFRIFNSPAGQIDYGNTILGFDAYRNNIDGTMNTAFGQNSLKGNISGFQNTCLGAQTLALNTVGYANVAIGITTMFHNISGHYNAAIGSHAMFWNTSGIQNTACGSAALNGNTTGSNNSALGMDALYINTIGHNNAALGTYCLGANTTGSSNSAVGYRALHQNSTGSANTAVGYQADASQAALTNATAIGANAIVNASNKIRLGDNNVTIVESSGVFTTVSDLRFKTDILENVHGLDFILRLRPVTYLFNQQGGYRRTGFIAQEVLTAANSVGFDFDGIKIPENDQQYYSLSYASFVVPLIKAVQEQQKIIDDQKTINENLQKQLDELKEVVLKIQAGK